MTSPRSSIWGALGHLGEGIVDVVRIDHTPAALDSLVARIAALEPDPAEVRGVLETNHGALVERLLKAGYVVVPVNPELIARCQGPARKVARVRPARRTMPRAPAATAASIIVPSAPTYERTTSTRGRSVRADQSNAEFDV